MQNAKSLNREQSGAIAASVGDAGANAQALQTADAGRHGPYRCGRRCRRSPICDSASNAADRVSGGADDYAELWYDTISLVEPVSRRLRDGGWD